MEAAIADRKERAPAEGPQGSPALTTELSVSGMTCNNCVRHVTEALQGVSGVRSVATQLETGKATVRWAGAKKDEELFNALEEAGYKATVAEGSAKAASKWSPLAGWRFNVYFGSAVTIPLMLLEWVFGVGMESWYKWLSFALVLPLQVLGGARFYAGAWSQLKVGQSNMDTLVSLGSTTAFLYSVWGLFAGWHQHLYFMDAAAILTLVSVGHYLEGKASAQAASSLKALMQLAPETARRLSAVGVEETVRVADLVEGDTIVLRAGDRIPTDGEVVRGSSSVTESMLTGESLPVEKSAGAKIYAGTINENGELQARVTATGEETALARIIEVVQKAQQSRASIQRLGDRVSSVFVPIVVVIAIATALWWALAPESARAVHAWLSQFLWRAHFPEGAVASAVFHAAAVLIIACPCAMGLATPIAIMAGTNVAAKRGILIRDGAALEKSGNITAVFFDKTGTLTEGKVSVAAVKEFAEGAQEIAATLASKSTHPLSKAVAANKAAAVGNFEVREVRGSGVLGKDGSVSYRLGSLRWLAAEGVRTQSAKEFENEWTSKAATVIGVSREQELVGLFALKDAPKARAREIVELLLREGKKVYLVTGDNRQTAEAIAKQVGVPAENVRAEVRPEGKVEVIQKLQASGERVAFAGDGINDAPALEQADLGIALMNASDVARESADIVLLKADLDAIPEALGLARATLRTIKQNLFWAFFYNALGVPLAALGFLSPIFSAVAMGASDLIVIGNALRLRGWKLRSK
ncbi:MAG TPA: cation-translocating P-type ATPase [Verrucomicrobiae bacterium]